MPINIKSFFDEDTATFTYVVSDLETSTAAIIDSVLNYNQYSGSVSTKSAADVISYLQNNNLKLEWILETHIHADHLTAASYIKNKLGGKIGIGSGIKDVLHTWISIFNTYSDTPSDASQFDAIFNDGEIFYIGSLEVKVLHTPGHTPACVSYYIEDNVFTGDTIFMPDLGTARIDFPGGSAKILYNSINRILSLPDHTKIFMGHDYPPKGRDLSYTSTVAEQKKNNILINENVTEEEYVLDRNKRDHGKSIPKLLFPSIQYNLRAGSFGNAEGNNTHYIKVPVDVAKNPA